MCSCLFVCHVLSLIKQIRLLSYYCLYTTAFFFTPKLSHRFLALSEDLLRAECIMYNTLAQPHGNSKKSRSHFAFTNGNPEALSWFVTSPQGTEIWLHRSPQSHEQVVEGMWWPSWSLLKLYFLKSETGPKPTDANFLTTFENTASCSYQLLCVRGLELPAWALDFPGT